MRGFNKDIQESTQHSMKFPSQDVIILPSCIAAELFNMGDLTFLGGSLWLTYYCHYHNNSIANTSNCFSIYDLTFVARPNL